MEIWNNILNLLFPPVCLSCDRFGYFICPKCQKEMNRLSGFICPDCLKPCPDGKLHKKCGRHIDGLISCWKYENITQQIIKEIKYRFYYASIPELIRLFLIKRQTSVVFDRFLQTKPIIVPVPLHPKRLNYRGFNQAQLIATELAKTWRLPMSSKMLVQTKFSKPQAELTKEERLRNVKDMFTVNPELLKLGQKPLTDKNMLLVDDVWTTGSTCQACAKVLKKLGAGSIWVVTMAR